MSDDRYAAWISWVEGQHSEPKLLNISDTNKLQSCALYLHRKQTQPAVGPYRSPKSLAVMTLEGVLRLQENPFPVNFLSK